MNRVAGQLRQTKIRRVPVWVWRLLMAHLAPGEKRRFNEEPIEDVDHSNEMDYAGDGARQHRLDVITPRDASGQLPVYVYFHGGGWTSGDKGAVTKYCASQASAGAVVVNANYRTAPRFQMRHMLQDAASVLGWVESHINEFGGDASRVVIGGDSAGGQIAALIAAAQVNTELVEHYDLGPSLGRKVVGVVQHCSAVDFSVMLERGFILSQSFVRMLLPHRDRSGSLAKAARYLSPIEWLTPRFPPVFVSTSEQDPFFGANLSFIRRLRALEVPVDVLTYDATVRNARHTWQQDYHFPESQEVYRRLATFVQQVAPEPRAVR